MPKQLALPPDLVQELAPLAEAERSAVLEILAEGRTAAKACEVSWNAHGWYDAEIRPAIPGDIACQAGCSWCCSQYVSITPPEAFELAAWIEATSTPAEREAWVALLTQRAAQARGKSVGAYAIAKIACAFLKEGLCTAYEHRPLLCRGYFSSDARRCEVGYKTPLKYGATIPAAILPRAMAHLINAGLVQGCADAGVQSGSYELHQAALIALTTPNAAARWAQGEPIFI
jgi:Fe-S-cluster containining protein